jgi:hypothetical protein
MDTGREGSNQELRVGLTEIMRPVAEIGPLSHSGSSFDLHFSHRAAARRTPKATALTDNHGSRGWRSGWPGCGCADRPWLRSWVAAQSTRRNNAERRRRLWRDGGSAAQQALIG